MNGTIVDKLKNKRRIHIDSVAFIYFIEQNPSYRSVVRPLFELLDRKQLVGLSSYITLLEVMVRPIKEGRLDLAQQYKDLLLRSQNFGLFPVDQTIAEQGAKIRANYPFRTPDAIQLATAVHQQADIFVTNDRHLKQFNQLEILILDDFSSTIRS